MSYGYNARNSHIDVNECTSRGACSISPSISALSELAMVFLQHIAYYVIKLEKLGASNDKLKFDIINVLASFVSVNEFSEEQLFEIVQNEYFMLEDTKKAYNDYCKRENITSKDLKEKILFNEKTLVSKAISIGEKIFLRNYNTRSSEVKNLITILDIVIKSVSLNIIKLTDFNEFDTKAYDEVILTLDLFNHRPLSSKKIADSITNLADLDSRLQLKISDLLLSSFGGISEVEVSHSSEKGKAILVSGNNFFDLLKVLRETKGQDVDIYTHSNLLITHSLKVFHEFEHLKVHYGDSTENCILDFATFPGAILLTKNSKNNTEYLYRGRLFSNDYIVPKGVIKIENNDYSALIEAAKNAKGFSKGKTKPDTLLGYNEDDLNKKFDKIIEKLNNGKIKRLFIVGTDAQLLVQEEYFKEFFNMLNDDEFVISFSYESSGENILTIPIGNYIPLATNILMKFFEKFPISDSKIIFMFTTCDVMTVSNIVKLESVGAQNIYMAKCSPTLVNPAVFETFSKKYNIHTTDEPIRDLSVIRNEKSTQ